MKILLTIPAMLLMMNLGFAQQEQKTQKPARSNMAWQQNPEDRAEKFTERLNQQLSLTAEQQQKIHELALQQEKARKAEMEQLQAGRKQYMNAIKEVLTPEQVAKWEENQKKAFGRADFKKRGKDFKRKGSMIKKDDKNRSRRAAADKKSKDIQE